MDLVDLMTEKRFVGQEFLTWLWFKSEERGNTVELEDSREDIGLFFEKYLILESGEGESLDRITCQGAQSEMLEARAGLAAGKKIEQARIRLIRGDLEFSFTMSGGLFEFRSVQLPKQMDDGDDNDRLARDGQTLVMLGAYQVIYRTMDELFKMFLRRALQEAWPKEVVRMRAWISRTTEATV